jgi:DNA-binding transcriptional LysR family regulator
MDGMSLPDLDIDALRAFTAIVDAGGFTAAAGRVGRTQSAVSVKIKRLEARLGRQLFERTSRSLALTRDGELLLGYARRLLELNDETVQRFADPGAEGEIRLGIAEYFVPQHLPGVLSRFARVFPRVHIEVRVGMSSGLIEAFDRHELDLVIAKRDDGVTRGRVIHRERLVWLRAPGLELPPGEPLPLCALPPPCVFRSRALEALKARGQGWRVLYTSESVMGVIAAARAGLGVAVTVESALPEDVERLTPAMGFPDLGEVELVVFGEGTGRREVKATLVGFIEDSLRRLPAPRQAA